MKSAKKLFTFVLPKSTLTSARSFQKKYGFKNFSALLRFAVEEMSTKKFKSKSVERTQISLRLEKDSFEKILALAAENKKSVAEILRELLSNISEISEKKFSAAANVSEEKSKKNKKNVSSKTKRAGTTKSR